MEVALSHEFTTCKDVEGVLLPGVERVPYDSRTGRQTISRPFVAAKVYVEEITAEEDSYIRHFGT